MRWVVNATPRPLYPQERPGSHCVGCWVGPRAGLDGCGKSRLPPGFDPRTVQPVASRYTDWAIPAHPSIFTDRNIVKELMGKILVHIPTSNKRMVRSVQMSGISGPQFIRCGSHTTVYHGHVLLPLLLGNERLIWSVAHVNESWNMSTRDWVYEFASLNTPAIRCDYSGN
jgi:hypothetical protein